MSGCPPGGHVRHSLAAVCPSAPGCMTQPPPRFSLTAHSARRTSFRHSSFPGYPRSRWLVLASYQIMEEMPDVMLQLDKLEMARQTVRDAEFADVWRNLDVQYIYGDTGSGKTRSVMEKYGYRNVYRVTDYRHPFDSYMGQDVILFEEFRSSLPLGDMLKYLDGYPVVLPCRYTNRQACFTKVYISTNIPIGSQYPEIQRESIGDFLAFLRRIGSVKCYSDRGIQEYSMVLLKDGFRLITEGEVIPFETSGKDS